MSSIGLEDKRMKLTGPGTNGFIPLGAKKFGKKGMKPIMT
jgi:hypothetical protein